MAFSKLRYIIVQSWLTAGLLTSEAIHQAGSSVSPGEHLHCLQYIMYPLSFSPLLRNSQELYWKQIFPSTASKGIITQHRWFYVTSEIQTHEGVKPRKKHHSTRIRRNYIQLTLIRIKLWWLKNEGAEREKGLYAFKQDGWMEKELQCVKQIKEVSPQWSCAAVKKCRPGRWNFFSYSQSCYWPTSFTPTCNGFLSFSFFTYKIPLLCQKQVLAFIDFKPSGFKANLIWLSAACQVSDWPQ